MTDDTMPFFNLVRERGGGDLLKDLAEAVLQRLMDKPSKNQTSRLEQRFPRRPTRSKLKCDCPAKSPVSA